MNISIGIFNFLDEVENHLAHPFLDFLKFLPNLVHIIVKNTQASSVSFSNVATGLDT